MSISRIFVISGITFTAVCAACPQVGGGGGAGFWATGGISDHEISNVGLAQPGIRQADADYTMSVDMLALNPITGHGTLDLTAPNGASTSDVFSLSVVPGATVTWHGNVQMNGPAGNYSSWAMLGAEDPVNAPGGYTILDGPSVAQANLQ